MGWTRWRPLAKSGRYSTEELDNDGPAVYELGLAGPRGGQLEPVYVGETCNEMARMTNYGGNGSHLRKLIDWHLDQGWVLCFRARAMCSKAAAKRMQDNLLRRFRYRWNQLLNQE